MGVFDQIKSAFGKEKTEAKKPQEPKPEANPPAAAAQETVHTVTSGETLWKIAEERLGDGSRYMEIFEANRDVLENPDHILPGQELKIP
ncbi:MAG: LysM peptidoglycan-binding domain-containing protein [Lysobacterales bacterium]|jgi:nucleoid-associated protein YgaU